MTHPRLSFLSPLGRFYLTPESAGVNYHDMIQDPAWAYEQGYAVPAMSTVLKGKFQFDAAKELRSLLVPFKKELKEVELPEIEVESLVALRTGDEVHTAIEHDLTGARVVDVNNLGAYAQPFYRGYEKFRADTEALTMKAIEQTYYIRFADNLRLGATADAVYEEIHAETGEKTIIVFDWKTGKTPPDIFKALLQCSGLGFGESIVYKGKAISMRQLPKKFGMVWLRTDGGYSLIDTSRLDIQIFMQLAWEILSVKVKEFHDQMPTTRSLV